MGSLTNVLERLVKDRTPIENIVLLSPRRLENSSLAGIERISRFPIVDISHGVTDGPVRAARFCTIHAFKGLESQVVIVVDIDEVEGEHPQSLLYVAMSRARSLLILMINVHVRKAVESRIRRAIGTGAQEMSDTLAAREFIVDFLRRELVGPSPGYPAVQISGQEILRAQDPAQNAIWCGILFPMRSHVPGQDETASDEEAPQEADSPHPDQIVEGSEPDRSADTQTNAGDNPPDTDREVTLANEYLPSAMGLSALLEVPERLRVDVSAGVYRNEELEWVPRTDRGGGKNYPNAWWRQSIDHSIQLSSGDLLGMGTITFERSVFDEDGLPVLSLHVVSRAHGDPAVSNRSRLVTFTLVNRRKSESRTPHNSDCFFQCGFSVRDARRRACFLSYPDQPRDDRDSEELSLQLLFLHRRTFAVGHGCAPEWSGVHDERATTIRTEVLPTCEVKPVLPTEVEGLDLRMIELMSDDRDTCTKLCTKLADEYEAWDYRKRRRDRNPSGPVAGTHGNVPPAHGELSRVFASHARRRHPSWTRRRICTRISYDERSNVHAVCSLYDFVGAFSEMEKGQEPT